MEARRPSREVGLPGTLRRGRGRQTVSGDGVIAGLSCCIL